MPRVERDATVHEQTVKDAAKHVAAYATKPRTRGSAKSSTVSKVIVNTDVWKTALALAGGDRFRLRVISPTEVRVENSRG
jgi:hypothetical protein